jgi:hypothetical protein
MNESKKLSFGNEERTMTNLSLARIMFGTNQDLRASSSMNAPAISSLSMLSSGENLTARDAGSSTGRFNKLLHKAFAFLHHKL